MHISKTGAVGALFGELPARERGAPEGGCGARSSRVSEGGWSRAWKTGSRQLAQRDVGAHRDEQRPAREAVAHAALVLRQRRNKGAS